MDYLQTRELYHWGILGQKWGRRRYQYADGSLTPAGKERYLRTHNEDQLRKLTPERSKAIYDRAERIQSSELNKIKKAAQLGYTATNDILNNIPAHIKNAPTKKQYPNNYKNLSTKELEDRIRRINAERRYSDLVGDTKIKNSGKEIVLETIQTVGSVMGIAIAGIALAEGIKNFHK